MTPEKELLLAILRQAMRDYIKLDPESDVKSAEFSEEGEWYDYRTAEHFLYGGGRIDFGSLSYTYEELCNFLNIDHIKLKKIIAKSAQDY